MSRGLPTSLSFYPLLVHTLSILYLVQDKIECYPGRVQVNFLGDVYYQSLGYVYYQSLYCDLRELISCDAVKYGKKL